MGPYPMSIAIRHRWMNPLKLDNFTCRLARIQMNRPHPRDMPTLGTLALMCRPSRQVSGRRRPWRSACSIIQIRRILDNGRAVSCPNKCPPISAWDPKTTLIPFHGVHLFYPPPSVRGHRPHVFHPTPVRDSPQKRNQISDGYESCNYQVKFAQTKADSHLAR